MPDPTTQPNAQYNTQFGLGVPFINNAPFLGGQILLIPTGSLLVNTPTAFNHTLNRAPNFALILDNGASFQGDIRVTARTTSTITIAVTNCPDATSGMTIWVA